MNANFDALVAKVEEAKIEADKFYGEKQNAQAGLRLRKRLKEIYDLAKQGRKDVSEMKEARQALKTA